MPTLSWYALRIRPRYETAVSQALAEKGYRQQFLPLYPSARLRPEKNEGAYLPLFPGYLFCRLNLHEQALPVLTTPGVKSIVAVGAAPVAIPDAEIAVLQSVIDSGLSVRPFPYLAAGAKVPIEWGPLRGHEGLVLSSESLNPGGQCRLIISVSLLQRSVAVEIQREWIFPVSTGVDSASFRTSPELKQGNRQWP